MNCQYHPTLKAKNYCSNCEQSFCVNCSDDLAINRNTKPNFSCFICGVSMVSLDTETVVPFWQRMGEVYQYPLQVQAMVTIFLVALFSSLLTGVGVWALLPLVAINLYSFACLRKTASGDNDVPGVESCFEGGIAPVFYGASISALVTVLSVMAYVNFGYGVGMVTAVFLIILMPAFIILIAIDQSFWSSLNPVRFFSIISITGNAYFVMVLLIMVMLLSIQLLIATFADTNFQGLSTFISVLILCYYNIVIFHVMGYVVYQYNKELGYKVTTRKSKQKFFKRTPKQISRAKVELLTKAGRFKSALEVAEHALTDESDLWEWRRVFKLHCVAKPSKRFAQFFTRYVNKLSAKNDYETIGKSYLEITKLIPDYEPHNSAQKMEIALGLSELGKHARAIRVVQSVATDSKDKQLVSQVLGFLANEYKQVPGSEQSAGKYQTLHALHISKYGF